MDPILIDECLTPYPAGVAKVRGLVAMHVAWLNREGSDDRALAELAAERDYIIVTNNRRDFLRLPLCHGRLGPAIHDFAAANTVSRGWPE